MGITADDEAVGIVLDVDVAVGVGVWDGDAVGVTVRGPDPPATGAGVGDAPTTAPPRSTIGSPQALQRRR
jgi:hypothetical protein